MNGGDFRIYHIIIIIWVASVIYFAGAYFAGIKKSSIDNIIKSLKSGDYLMGRLWNNINKRSAAFLRIMGFLIIIDSVFLPILAIHFSHLDFERNIETAFNMVAASFVIQTILILFFGIRGILYRKRKIALKRLIPFSIFMLDIGGAFYIAGFLISLILHAYLLVKYFNMY